jgi:hypothetical protein
MPHGEGRAEVSRPRGPRGSVNLQLHPSSSLARERLKVADCDLTVNPLFAFSFLETFLGTLQDYLGEVTESTIKDEFDTVYMVRTTTPSSPLTIIAH